MFTLEIIKAIVLGIVEGLTEWLPVSSTGHMILVDEFMSLNVSKAFMDMFLVVIQLGAILAVVALNFDRLNPFSKRKTYLKKRQTISLWGKVIVGCIPAAVRVVSAGIKPTFVFTLHSSPNRWECLYIKGIREVKSG